MIGNEYTHFIKEHLNLSKNMFLIMASKNKNQTRICWKGRETNRERMEREVREIRLAMH